MGNSPSVEARGKGSRTTQRLSKPRTGNPATAGLLTSNSISDIIRRPPSTVGRRLSLPQSSTPIPSPRFLEPEGTALGDLVVPHGASSPVEDFSPSSLLQSDSQGALCRGGQSIGVVVSSSRGRRMSRTESGCTAAGEGYDQAQPVLAVNSPRTASLVNYDASSYEARRLLNLVEASPVEDQTIVSESQSQGALSRRQSYTTSYRPAHSDVTMPLPRTNSDASLYAPIRRRSLMTPGLATRPARADLIAPPSIPAGLTSSPPPSSSDPLQPMGVALLSVPHSSSDASLIPRAHTPCEADYQQTGAFKHGTLRITNGSPARTPARESIDGDLCDNLSSAIGQSSYFDAGSQIRDVRNDDSNNSQYPAPPFLTTAPLTSESSLVVTTGKHEPTTSFLPELKLTLSPLSIDELQTDVPELQTTSKHTATEDQLFEDESPDSGIEILNLRLDNDAKHSPSPPNESLKEGRPKDINRSDSGVVASPVSGAPHKTLSKADSGYSSSVSVHSSSSRRKGRGEIGHSHNHQADSSQAPSCERVKLSGSRAVPIRSGTTGTQDKQPQSPLPDELPPPVPEKDDHINAPKRETAPPNDSWAPARETNPVLDKALGSVSGPSHHSSLSIGNARQPGRLQRFLSGARAPLTVHVTHALDGEIGVPPVPRDVQEKLHERAALSPNSLEDHLASTDTGKERFRPPAISTTSPNVDDGSATRAPQNHGSSTQRDQDKVHGFKSSFNIHSIGSTITRAASSVINKNPIFRKTTFTKTKPDDVNATIAASGAPDRTTQHIIGTTQWQRNDTHETNLISLSSIDIRERYGGSTVAADRANSLSAPISPNPGIYNDARHASLPSQAERHTAAFRMSSLPGQYSVSHTPPPISMKTRHTGQLRVPPPIRPRSTPPAKSAAPTLSHKSSRDGVQSYPPYDYPKSSNYTDSSRRSSQESFYRYSAAQIQGFLNQPSQIPSTIPWTAQPRPEEYRGQVGTTNPKHGMALSRGPSFENSRHNSLASQASRRSNFSNGQSWSHHSPYDTPTLKHRSSYDGYSFQAGQSYGQENGPYPPLPRTNGQMYMPGNVSGQPVPHQSGQYQQHARYLSRGHLRHHSLDQYGYPTPYRVLHSYNSPAYRGVPIWSA
ncbi:hypothetical protein F5Y07DRAFT_56840 [Xylaria sp. FL0933]|nr:hypothetical protein F5Y07DRAFT_56840 [Xylaria sp. FL0933]